MVKLPPPYPPSGAGHDPGLRQSKVEHVAPVEWQVLHRRPADGCADSRIERFHLRGLRLHVDRFTGRSDSHMDIHAQRLVDVEPLGLGQRFAEGSHLHRHRIIPNRKIEYLVGPGLVRGGR